MFNVVDGNLKLTRQSHMECGAVCFVILCNIKVNDYHSLPQSQYSQHSHILSSLFLAHITTTTFQLMR